MKIFDEIRIINTTCLHRLLFIILLLNHENYETEKQIYSNIKESL